MEITYAGIVDGVVVDLLLFDSPSNYLIQEFKTLHNFDNLLPVTDERRPLDIGAAWNGTIYIDVKPTEFPSWILNEIGRWIPPIPYPTDKNFYFWDEENVTWVKVDVPSNENNEISPESEF